MSTTSSTSTRVRGTLPDAAQQNPACGSCGDETHFDGDHFVCEACELIFSTDDFSASFANPDAPACGVPCDNWWHGDHRIKPGHGYNCGTCLLPSGHTSMHWTDCLAVDVELT